MQKWRALYEVRIVGLRDNSQALLLHHYCFLHRNITGLHRTLR